MQLTYSNANYNGNILWVGILKYGSSKMYFLRNTTLISYTVNTLPVNFDRVVAGWSFPSNCYAINGWGQCLKYLKFLNARKIVCQCDSRLNQLVNITDAKIIPKRKILKLSIEETLQNLTSFLFWQLISWKEQLRKFKTFIWRF